MSCKCCEVWDFRRNQFPVNFTLRCHDADTGETLWIANDIIGGGFLFGRLRAVGDYVFRCGAFWDGEPDQIAYGNTDGLPISGTVLPTDIFGVASIDVDDDLNYYVCGQHGVDRPEFEKRSSDGTLLWKYEHQTDLFDCCHDGSGGVYLADGRNSWVQIQRRDADGTLLWNDSPLAGGSFLCCASNGGKLWAGGVVTSTNGVVYQYPSDGDPHDWVYNNGITAPGVPAGVYDICGDSNGNVYFVGGTNTTEGENIKKLDSSGTLQWTANHGTGLNAFGTDLYGIATDGDYIYVTGDRFDEVTTRKFDLDGNEQTNDSWPIDFGHHTRRIAAGGGKVYILTKDANHTWPVGTP